MQRFFRRPWTIQFASSLYANKGWQTAWSHLQPGKGNALALLGNCVSAATPKEKEESYLFLKECSTAWQQILLVPGPTEYQGGIEKAPFTSRIDTLREMVGEINELSSFGSDVAVLEQGELELPYHSIVLLGATGWGMPEGAVTGLTSGIYTAGGPVKACDLTRWCKEDLEYLKERVKWWQRAHPSTQLILLTHSLPKGHLVQPGLPTEVYTRIRQEVIPHELTTPILKSPNVAAWLGGALGSCVSGMHRSTFLASNALFSTEDCSLVNCNYLRDRHFTLQMPRNGGGTGTGSGSGGGPTALQLALA